MKHGVRSNTLNHRRVMVDMLELALQGTVVAILVAIVAMGLIALLVG